MLPRDPYHDRSNVDCECNWLSCQRAGSKVWLLQSLGREKACTWVHDSVFRLCHDLKFKTVGDAATTG
jgi:hypothetical protein